MCWLKSIGHTLGWRSGLVQFSLSADKTMWSAFFCLDVLAQRLV
jgi:hypothetical protein